MSYIQKDELLNEIVEWKDCEELSTNELSKFISILSRVNVYELEPGDVMVEYTINKE